MTRGKSRSQQGRQNLRPGPAAHACRHHRETTLRMLRPGQSSKRIGAGGSASLAVLVARPCHPVTGRRRAHLPPPSVGKAELSSMAGAAPVRSRGGPRMPPL
jgi:hypothetical protein